MLLIGEKLNSSCKSVRDAMNCKDENFLKEIILKQKRSGSDFLDINTEMCEDVLYAMEYTLHLIRKYANEIGVCIDSPRHKNIIHALGYCKDRNVIINSLDAQNDAESYTDLISVASQSNTSYIVMPQYCNENLDSTITFISKLQDMGINSAQIFLDISVNSVAYSAQAATDAVNRLALFKKSINNVKCIGGLSNISFGMPNRKELNNTLAYALSLGGIDALIADTEALEVRENPKCRNVLFGSEQEILEYIRSYRTNGN